MKKILLLLLFTIASYGQAVFDEGIQITNTESATATKVNVQEANGKVNTQTIKTGFNKNIGLGGSDVVGANTLLNQYSTTPIEWTATAFDSGQVVFYGGKQWIAKMATVAGDVPSASSKWEEITFEALATKAPISSVHNPVTLGTANGLSLSTQQLSLELASSGVTGALSGTDWNTFNGKVGGTGTDNFLTKWSGTNTVNASGAWRETSNRLANAADNGSSDFQVTGQIDLKSKNTQGDGGQLGAELLTTGTGDASWTGTSFATGYTHATGSVTTLTSALAPVINNLYQVAYTVTGRTAGSFTIAFGGTTTSGITSTGLVGDKASTTSNLVITPTSDFNGTIVLSIKQITAGTASFVFRDNGGVIRNELRFSGGNNTASGLNALQNNTTGVNNTANGVSALLNNTTGVNNTANGVSALLNNTTGDSNTANGVCALQSNTTGVNNTANGVSALLNNTTGVNNTASGVSALQSNTTGVNNTASGVGALQNNTTGGSNTASGVSALINNTTGVNNTASGVGALQNNTTGGSNTASGVSALINNTTGVNNTASGVGALQNNTTGGSNTASGVNALINNTTGVNNTANGVGAGRFISNGATSLTVANNSTFLGANTKALSDNSTNETVVGYNAIGDGNNTVSIGNTSVISSRLRGRFLQGNVVDNSIDSGQFSGNVLATGFKTASGTASQFLKANGSVDSNTYLTSASLPTVDQTIIDGSTNAVSGNAVFDGLATKFPTPTGLTTNYLPKWNGSGFWNSQIFDNGGNVGIGTTTPNSKFEVIGNIISTMIDSYPTIGATNYGSVGFPLLQLRNVKNGVDKGWNIENGRTVNGDLGFYNAGGERVIIKDNGRVLINKTNDDLTNQLQVAGTISALPATTANQVPTWGQVQAAARPYKVYTALLTQTGTNAPVATVLENTLGATISYSLGGTGFVVATSSTTSFTDPNKVFISISNGNGAGFFSVLRIQTNQVRIAQQNIAGANTDGLLQTANFEIRVYN